MYPFEMNKEQRIFPRALIEHLVQEVVQYNRLHGNLSRRLPPPPPPPPPPPRIPPSRPNPTQQARLLNGGIATKAKVPFRIEMQSDFVEELKIDEDEHSQRKPWNLHDSFCMIVVGPPDSGKTTLIAQLLEDDLYGMYHYIFTFSPNNIFGFGTSKSSRMVKGENWFLKTNYKTIEDIFDWVLQVNIGVTSEHPIKILFIFDDVCWTLNTAGDKMSDWITLMTNRRHIKEDRISMSVIFTAHRWIGALNKNIRATCESVILFKPERTFNEVANELEISAPSLKDIITTFEPSDRFIHLSHDSKVITSGWNTEIVKISY